MRADSTSLYNGDASFAVINACYVLTDQYRCILSDLGKEHHLTENEMLGLGPPGAVSRCSHPKEASGNQSSALSPHPFAAWWILCGEKGIYRPAWMRMTAAPGSFTWNRRGVPWPKNFGSACISAWAMYFRKFQALMYRALQP